VDTEAGPTFIPDPALPPQDVSTDDTGSTVRRGNRPMKEYYIHDSEFRELKKAGASATILFAIGSASIGFSANTHIALAFVDHLATDIKVQWEILRNVSVVIGLTCYVFAVIQSLVGYNLVERIKGETQHGGEKYEPKSRYKVAFWALVLAFCFVLGGAVVWVWK
jgi:hypothetical protein